MSFNRKTTTYVKPSVTAMLSAAQSEAEVDEAIAFARLTYHDATAATKRKWERKGEKVKQALRLKRFQLVTL